MPDLTRIEVEQHYLGRKKLKPVFIRIKANPQSIRQRKTVFGFGITDSWYMVSPTIDDLRVFCPIYRIWKAMLMRAYCPIYKALHPTYRDVTVCNEWLLFSNFLKWVEGQDWREGMDLDKDIRVPGNKIYGPEYCLFVSHEINVFFADYSTKNGYPEGVSLKKSSGRLLAQCSFGKGRKKHLGYFTFIQEAQLAYLNFKEKIARKLALSQTNEIVITRLIEKAEYMRWQMAEIIFN